MVESGSRIALDGEWDCNDRNGEFIPIFENIDEREKFKNLLFDDVCLGYRFLEWNDSIV